MNLLLYVLIGFSSGLAFMIIVSIYRYVLNVEIIWDTYVDIAVNHLQGMEEGCIVAKDATVYTKGKWKEKKGSW